VVSVDVPATVADDPGRVRVRVDAPPPRVAPESLRISRYDDEAGAWEPLETTVAREDGGLVLSADTPGFSTFAVTATDSTVTPTPTASPTPATTDPVTPSLTSAVTPTPIAGATPMSDPVTATATETTTGTGPGFGTAAALAALAVAALLASRQS
jgi:PGF-CTERM protein